MTLFVAGVVLFGAALLSSGAWAAAGGRSPEARLAVGVAHFTALGLSALLTFLFWLLGGMRCYESCGLSGGWRDDRAAWQWELVSGLGFSGLALTIAAVVLTVKRRRSSSWLALLAPAACYLAAWILYSSGGA